MQVYLSFFIIFFFSGAFPNLFGRYAPVSAASRLPAAAVLRPATRELIGSSHVWRRRR